MVGLDSGRGSDERCRLDHVRVKCPLSQKRKFTQFFCLLFKDLNKGVTDSYPFLLRVFHAMEGREKSHAGIHVMEALPETPAQPAHILNLPLSQEPVVDEDAVQAVSNGTVDQGRCD